ncbi:MAG TPA: hypothetical protein VIW69_09030 [Candidatus Elarobacter sp.]
MLGIDAELFTQLAGNMNDAERVFEACMHGAWIHQVGHCQLSDPSKTLKHRRINDVALASFDSDKTVDRITEVAVGRH